MPIRWPLRARDHGRAERPGRGAHRTCCAPEPMPTRCAWRSAGWPKTPRALAGRLRRAQTFLRTLGIEIDFSREGRAGTRMIRISAAHRKAHPADRLHRRHRPRRPAFDLVRKILDRAKEIIVKSRNSNDGADGADAKTHFDRVIIPQVSLHEIEGHPGFRKTLIAIRSRLCSTGRRDCSTPRGLAVTADARSRLRSARTKLATARSGQIGRPGIQ